jgi:nocardicin N-oxygenase
MTTDPPTYPFGPPAKLELHPNYDALRRTNPVARVRVCPVGQETHQGYLVTRYEDARRVLSAQEFSRARAVGRHPSAMRPEESLVDTDDPDHQRLRGCVASAFTPRQIRRRRPRIQQITDDLLDAMAAAGPPADLVASLALPLPVTVIAELLGVDKAEQDRFAGWSARFLSHNAYDRTAVAQAHEEMSRYLRARLEQRQVDPRDDLISRLAGAVAAGNMTHAEAVNLAVGLLVGGFETTASQLTNMIYVLVTHPDQQRRLCDRPDLLPAAVEELLRYVPLGSQAGMPRVTVKDIRLGDILIPAGETVLAARAAANRDHAAFPDPDTLILDRQQPLPHLAFGYGTHYCLGAHLARTELQVAIGTLLSRFGPLRLAVEESALKWKEGLAVRGLHRLPLTWDA